LSPYLNDSRTGPAILFVEDDEEVCDPIAARLQQAGYSVLVARNEEDAVHNLAGDQFPIGLILVNQKMPSDEALVIGRRIRERARLDPSVPMIVLPYEYEAAVEGTDQPVGDNDYKTYMVDIDQLTTLIKRLFPV